MWEIEWTDECREWISTLDDNIREDILAHLIVLSEKGPALGRPYADTISGSKIKNLKELRVKRKKQVIRIFFVFTRDRIGLLITGGDKRGDKRFYERMIPLAEKIYDRWVQNQAGEQS